ncbi:MAG: hypothetical protein R3D27_09610 [Hyphomicrobiaceae bacterium]
MLCAEEPKGLAAPRSAEGASRLATKNSGVRAGAWRRRSAEAWSWEGNGSAPLCVDVSEQALDRGSDMDHDVPRHQAHTGGPPRMAVPGGDRPHRDDATDAAAALTEHQADNPFATFVDRNPLTAVAAAVVIGAGIAALVMPRRGTQAGIGELQRELRRYSRRMQRKVSRELRSSKAADAVSRISAALPDVDLKHAFERMSDLANSAVAAARRRLNGG